MVDGCPVVCALPRGGVLSGQDGVVVVFQQAMMGACSNAYDDADDDDDDVARSRYIMSRLGVSRQSRGD